MPRPLSSASILDRYLDKLKKLKAEYAVDALSSPRDKTSFEYGEHVGVLKGLVRAEQLLQEASSQADDESK